MRTSSGDRKVRNYGTRSDSPNPVRKDSEGIPLKGVRSDTGRGWDGIGREGVDAVPWSQRRSKLLAYVARVLPDEHPGLAASAALTIKMSGAKPTPEAILERLRAQGRTAEQMREKGWIK